MRNIYYVYMAPKNYEMMVHYQDTIIKRIPLERIAKHVDKSLTDELRKIFGPRSIPVWGSRDGKGNRPKFSKMKKGDEIIIVEGSRIRLVGKIASTTINSQLSNDLWKDLHGGQSEPWSLIYFIANPVEVDVAFEEFSRFVGYDPDLQLRGFSSVAPDRSEHFYDLFDDVYSVVLQLNAKKKPQVKAEATDELEDALETHEDQIRKLDEVLEGEELSEHLRKQLQLHRIGLNSGSDVWVPKPDQTLIQKEFGPREFQRDFALGDDISAKYVEYIDVLWSQEMVVQAAFEIEHTSAIYSGLLRFADLRMVKPNHPASLIIAAPNERRSKVVDQVRRPTFRHLHFDKDVRFLAYEAIDEVDSLILNEGKVISPILLYSKSESLI